MANRIPLEHKKYRPFVNYYETDKCQRNRVKFWQLSINHQPPSKKFVFNEMYVYFASSDIKLDAVA